MAAVKVETPETIKGTVAELQKVFNMTSKDDYAAVNGLLKFLEKNGVAKISGQRKSESGKGKPASVWEIPSSFTFNAAALTGKKPEVAA